MKQYLRLRYRLIPYLYMMNRYASEDGVPRVRPVYWLEPERDEAYQVPNEYFFGTELLAAPITQPNPIRIRWKFVCFLAQMEHLCYGKMQATPQKIRTKIGFPPNYLLHGETHASSPFLPHLGISPFCRISVNGN